MRGDKSEQELRLSHYEQQSEVEGTAPSHSDPRSRMSSAVSAHAYLRTHARRLCNFSFCWVQGGTRDRTRQKSPSDLLCFRVMTPKKSARQQCNAVTRGCSSTQSLACLWPVPSTCRSRDGEPDMSQPERINVRRMETNRVVSCPLPPPSASFVTRRI